jgi:hypothetical protein
MCICLPADQFRGGAALRARRLTRQYFVKLAGLARLGLTNCCVQPLRQCCTYSTCPKAKLQTIAVLLGMTCVCLLTLPGFQRVIAGNGFVCLRLLPAAAAMAGMRLHCCQQHQVKGAA